MNHYSALSSSGSSAKKSRHDAQASRSGGRWYDEMPELRNAVSLMQVLPESVQVVMSQMISASLRKESRRKARNGELRQIGPEKILGLLKSKAKNRWYDQEANIHKAFNDIYLTEGMQCRQTSLRIIVAVAELQAAGLTHLSERDCGLLIADTFQCNRRILLEKAHASLGLLAFAPEEPPVALPTPPKTVKTIPAKTKTASISEQGDRLMAEELRHLKL
jgi:hypothetical protein